jgi:hypothetical protein
MQVRGYSKAAILAFGDEIGITFFHAALQTWDPSQLGRVSSWTEPTVATPHLVQVDIISRRFSARISLRMKGLTFSDKEALGVNGRTHSSSFSAKIDL